MTTIVLHLPESLHNATHELAAKDNVSINQFILLALAEKISALATEEYLAARAARGSREKFEAALSKVADVEPEADDPL